LKKNIKKIRGSNGGFRTKKIAKEGPTGDVVNRKVAG